MRPEGKKRHLHYRPSKCLQIYRYFEVRDEDSDAENDLVISSQLLFNHFHRRMILRFIIRVDVPHVYQLT